MAFHEVQFPADISEGAVGGPMFSTIVVVSGGGSEQRIGLWSKPRHKWDVSHALADPTLAELLLNFFIARQGRLHGFRFKDWSDFTVGNPDLNEAVTCLMITPTTYQIRKVYGDAGRTWSRDIRKPVPGTVQVFDDGENEILTGWSVNNNTGVITFDVDPAMNVKVTCEFDVPVRFDTDEMQMEQESVGSRNWTGIPIVEIRDVASVDIS